MECPLMASITLILWLQIPCLSCGDVIADDSVVVVFDCAEHHVICVDCFKMFCLSRLNERQFVLDPALVSFRRILLVPRFHRR